MAETLKLYNQVLVEIKEALMYLRERLWLSLTEPVISSMTFTIGYMENATFIELARN